MPNPRVQRGVLFFHGADEKLRQHLPLDSQRPPHQVKVDRVHIILRHGQCIRDVQNSMPPAAGHVDGFSGPLHTNQRPQVGPLSLQDLGQPPQKKVDRLEADMRELGQVLAFDDPLGNLVGEYDPELVALETDVPGRRVQRVHVHLGAGAARADEQPAVGRPHLGLENREVVLAEKFGDVVLAPQVLVRVAVVEEVQRRVVRVGAQVVDISAITLTF